MELIGQTQDLNLLTMKYQYLIQSLLPQDRNLVGLWSTSMVQTLPMFQTQVNLTADSLLLTYPYLPRRCQAFSLTLQQSCVHPQEAGAKVMLLSFK